MSIGDRWVRPHPHVCTILYSIIASGICLCGYDMPVTASQQNHYIVVKRNRGNITYSDPPHTMGSDPSTGHIAVGRGENIDESSFLEFLEVNELFPTILDEAARFVENELSFVAC